MGEVKDTVKGDGLKDKKLPPPSPAPATPPVETVHDFRANRLVRALRVLIGKEDVAHVVRDRPTIDPVNEVNLVDHFASLREEVSYLIEIKDTDTYSEGDEEKPENIRKAALLRSVHSLLTASQTLLEDY
jgi:hypothetical protein